MVTVEINSSSIMNKSAVNVIGGTAVGVLESGVV